MKQLFLSVATIFFYAHLFAQTIGANKIPTVYIDKSGVLRWEDSKKEASFYGVNYTVPFAHAYRALQYKNINHKYAIDKDVYHMARLGFNAYRIHIWDVEISDSMGNLLSNDHLDLLDYLIFKLQEKGIYTLVTMMTNFGNGYPERNINTGAFTYLYDKCNVHTHPEAIKAQQRYVSQLVNHRNAYTGKDYKSDPYIVGFEINNEPCHTGDIETTRNYVKTMLATFKNAGNKKPIFYNVSHNEDHVPAYYQEGVQGTTYQWYPIGLVAGKERKGNFLPYVDSYPISFSNVKDFDKKALAVYEYDPADMLGSYLHPAMARTFRSSGFQWITQFAYDPIDIAQYNTEYQTHYLNLAYTPSKALSTMIAAEVAYQVPRKQKFDNYPENSIFSDFKLDYVQDLSVLNDGTKFYYSNSNTIKPKSIATLKNIAGKGNSSVVKYEGTGAYFIDQLEQGVWRLEIMPDVEIIKDPFEKPTLDKEVAVILYNYHSMHIDLQDLESDFCYSKVDAKGIAYQSASGNSFLVTPGVYIIKNKNNNNTTWNAGSRFKYGFVKDYYAPEATVIYQPILLHTAKENLEKGNDIIIDAKVFAKYAVDSVIFQTNEISFWKDKNPYIKLHKNGNSYSATLPDKFLKNQNLSYTLTVFSNGKSHVFPDNKEGAVLDWNHQVQKYYSSKIVTPHSPIVLFEARNEVQSSLEHYAIPDSSYLSVERNDSNIMDPISWKYNLISKNDSTRFFWKKYIRESIEERKSKIKNSTRLKVIVSTDGLNGDLQIGFITRQGFTYVKQVSLKNGVKNSILDIEIKDLKLVPTAILPSPYPVFLSRYFIPARDVPFDINEIEHMILSTAEKSIGKAEVSLQAIWID